MAPPPEKLEIDNEPENMSPIKRWGRPSVNLYREKEDSPPKSN